MKPYLIFSSHLHFANSRFLEFTIYNWPVNVNNELHLDDLKSTHNVRQLPAYDIRGNLINPSEYEEKLAGAIARVCFTLVHFTIKQKHVFNALVKDITILRPPTSITPTTLKHILHPKKKTEKQLTLSSTYDSTLLFFPTLY